MAKKKADKERDARGRLVSTIAKIADLEPTMGGKWRESMLRYYYSRLAELMLYQQGIDYPVRAAIDHLASHMREVLTASDQEAG
jgi:hypothetical protein